MARLTFLWMGWVTFARGCLSLYLALERRGLQPTGAGQLAAESPVPLWPGFFRSWRIPVLCTERLGFVKMRLWSILPVLSGRRTMSHN